MDFAIKARHPGTAKRDAVLAHDGGRAAGPGLADPGCYPQNRPRRLPAMLARRAAIPAPSPKPSISRSYRSRPARRCFSTPRFKH